MKIYISNLLVIITFLIEIPIFSQTSQLINYQGKITGTTDTTLNLNFYIYDAENGGTALWNQQIENVDVKRGVFHVLLGGSAAPFDANVFGSESGNRWLEVEIDGKSPFRPRYQLTSVPFAIQADKADTARAAQTALTLSAADGDPVDAVVVDNEGNIGIGTTTPTQKLTVNGYVASQTVAFSAYVATNDLTGNFDRLPLTAVSNNIGGYYFPDSSTFITPVKGIYLFTMTGLSSGMSSGTLYWFLMVNDEHAFSGTGGDVVQKACISWYQTNLTCSRTVILDLNIGDKITIKQEYQGNDTGKCDNYRSGLEGVLLFALPDSLQ